jgi:HlyD family secretion protein
MEQNALFRKSALDKLASPERLDVLMQVTSPMGWLALLTIGVVLAAVLTWGFLGSIPERVDGQGILLRGGGLREIKAEVEGTLQKFGVQKDQIVKPNQLIGEIAQPTGDDAVNIAQVKLNQARQEAASGAADDQVQIATNNNTITTYQSDIATTAGRIKVVEADLALRREQLEKKIITKARVDALEQELLGLNSKISGLRAQIAGLNNSNTAIRQRQRARDAAVAMAQAELQKALNKVTVSTQVKASIEGRVIDVRKSVGDRVRVGEVLAVVEPPAGELNPVIYVSSREGQRIKPGMAVQVSPFEFRREDWGFIKGKVVSVSEFPVTQEAMQAKIANAQLVTLFMGKDAPLEVQVELATNPDTVSGFDWSSSSGPPTKVNGGTRLTGSFLVEERAPITLVLPMLKGALGIS